jgi:hypothetical protein
MSLSLSDGSVIIQDVPGEGGAKFFGWADGSIASMTLACDGCDFAFAQMVEGAEVVPEPMTLVLLGCGLVGIAAWRRSRPS